MDKKLIIVTGYPASGKTTFSMKLSESLNVPFFNLDSIKKEIGKVIEINSWDDSKRLGMSSFYVLMYILESILKVDKSIIVENSFIKDHEALLISLLKKYEYEPLTFIFYCDLKILHKRFIERENSTERDKGNKVFGIWNDFRDFEHDIKPFDDFSVDGRIIKIDTSNFKEINFDSYIGIAKNYIYD